MADRGAGSKLGIARSRCFFADCERGHHQ